MGGFLKHLILILIGLLLVGWVVMRYEPCLGKGNFWEQLAPAKEMRPRARRRPTGLYGLGRRLQTGSDGTQP